MRSIHLNSRTVFVVGLAVTVLTAGVAYAYWTSGGAGTGTVATASGTIALTVEQASLASMYPGGTAQALSGTFGNTNAAPVYVTSVTASISSVVDGNGDPIAGCTTADFTLADDVMTVGAEVPVGSAVGSWGGATIELPETGVNQDACKSATVNLAYVVA